MPKYEQGQIFFMHIQGLVGNDAIMYKDWSSKPLVIYSELHEP